MFSAFKNSWEKMHIKVRLVNIAPENAESHQIGITIHCPKVLIWQCPTKSQQEHLLLPSCTAFPIFVPSLVMQKSAFQPKKWISNDRKAIILATFHHVFDEKQDSSSCTQEKSGPINQLTITGTYTNSRKTKWTPAIRSFGHYTSIFWHHPRSPRLPDL